MINDNQAIERVISTIARMVLRHQFLYAPIHAGSEQLSKNMPVNVVASEVEGTRDSFTGSSPTQNSRNLIVRK